MYTIKLSPRLAAVASFVGKGSIADIGTDHALLPIYLVGKGHSPALASDIKEGPCQRARVNVYSHGLHSKIRVVCCPGLDAVPEFKPDNIIIAGMGGEMISSILDASDYPQKSGCRLILQPQSMQDVLRRHLLDSGFKIIAEAVVLDSDKYYQVISAEYDGVKRQLKSCAEYRLGALNLARANAALSDTDSGWLKKVRASAERRISGRLDSKDDTPEQADDRIMVDIINGILKDRT